MYEQPFPDFKMASEFLEATLEKYGKTVANTLELTNVIYTVDRPYLSDLSPHQPWAGVEFEDRIATEVRNPGNAWKKLPEVWEPMMEEYKGPGDLVYYNFAYTYNERIMFQIGDIIKELGNNHNSREAYLSIWNSTLDPHRLSRRRVPCTLGYQFSIRDEKLNMVYLQRSCNFIKHFQDDVYLARKLQEWMASLIKGPIAPGTFSHWVGSLHKFV